MNKVEKGLLLKMVNYRDFDGMATILLKESGLRRFIYRSYYKPTSKLLSKGLPLTELSMHFNFKEEGLLRAGQIDVLNNFSTLKNDVTLNLLGSIWAEIMLAFQPKIDEAKDYYELGVNYLSSLETSAFPTFTLAVMINECLILEGLQPVTDYDVRNFGSKVNGFSIEEGGFIYTKQGSPLTTSQLKEIRLLSKMDFDKLELVDPFEVNQKVLDIMLEYFTYHTSISLKSWEILRQL